MKNEPVDYRELYEQQKKETEIWREAAELFREDLRDQFAMAAMQGLLSNPEYGICKSDAEKYGSGDAVTAHHAYTQADAMLEARKAR